MIRGAKIDLFLGSNFMKLTREEIEKEVEIRLCQLANVINPDHAERTMKDLIYGHPVPDLSPPKLIALGRVQALFDILKMFSKEK